MNTVAAPVTLRRKADRRIALSVPRMWLYVILGVIAYVSLAALLWQIPDTRTPCHWQDSVTCGGR